MGISKSSEKLSNIMAKRIAKILTTIAIPRITFFSTDYYLSQVKFDILSCAIAVKLYENELGNLPEDLSQLKSRYFDQLPKDPFNQFKDLSYKKTNYGWVVYSFGPDKKDDSAGIAYKGSGDIKPGDIFFKGYIDFLDKFGGSNVNQ